jgi:hypothetical protein
MRLHNRYPDRHEGSPDPISLDLYRAPPGSTARRPLLVAGSTAKVTVKRYGGLTHGETVINARSAVASPDATNRFDYTPTSAERRALTVGAYQVWWKVDRGARKPQHGPIELRVVESPYAEAGEPMALVFNVPSNSPLLSLI